MSEKTLNNIRIVHKHDIEENWLKATNFIPKQGELIIYDVDDKYNYERMKIGDGITLVNDLPFNNDKIVAIISASVVDGKIVRSCDKTFDELWNAYEIGHEILFYNGNPSSTFFTTNTANYRKITNTANGPEKRIYISFNSHETLQEVYIKEDNTVTTSAQTDIITKASLKDTTGNATALTMSQKAITDALNLKADKEHTHSYNDLENKPFYETADFQDMRLVCDNFEINDDQKYLYFYGDTLAYTDYYSTISIYDYVNNNPDKKFITRIWFNNESYDFFELKSINKDWQYAFGNLSLMDDSQENTGEPFCYCGERVFTIPELITDNPTIIPFYVEIGFENIKQLDEKFIPDTIARVSDIPEEDLYIINLYGNETDGYTADRTREEIYEAALNDSLRVICRHTNDANETKNFELASISSIGITFSYVAGLGSGTVRFSKYGKPIQVYYYAFQNATDDFLETDSKEVYKAINELHSEINEHTEQLNNEVIKTSKQELTDEAQTQARINQGLYYKNKKEIGTLENISFVDGVASFEIPTNIQSETKIIQIDFVNVDGQVITSINRDVDYSFIGEYTHSQYGASAIDIYTYEGADKESGFNITLKSNNGNQYVFSHSHPSASNSFTTNLIFYEIELHQVEEEFIPDTIARAKDIPELASSFDNILNYNSLAADAKAVGEALNLKADISLVTDVESALYNAIVENDIEDKAYVDEKIAALPQSDWNQNDETASDYIQNRTHYALTENKEVCISWDGNFNGREYFPHENGYFVKVTEDVHPIEAYYGATFDYCNEPFGTIQEFHLNRENILYMYTDEPGDLIMIVFDDYEFLNMQLTKGVWLFKTEWGYINNLRYIAEIEDVKKLDEKFIPDSIARVENIPEQVQTDWNQNDETAKDFIKGRTHWTEQKLETIAEGYGNNIMLLDSSGDFWKPSLLETDKEYAVVIDGKKYFITTYQTWDGFGSYYIGFGDSRLNNYLPVLDEEGGAQFDENGELIYEQDMRYPSDIPFFCEYICEDNGGSMPVWIHSFNFIFKDELEHDIKICNILDELEYHQLDEKFIPSTIATKQYVDKETAGVQNHLVDNDLHVILGERAKWNTAYDHSQDTNMHNAYSSFSFRNAISTYAAEPEDPTDPAFSDFNVSAQTSNHQLKFIAANNLIEFNSSDTSDSDEVEITIHADPEGAADEAEANAKAYADSIKNDLLNGAGAAYDTLKELGELIDENHDAITVLEGVAINKADKAEVEALKTQVTATSLILADAITGQKYEIQIQNGQLVSFPVGE